MKVVLREDVRRLGKKGDVVNVADGYARNFLIPRKIALLTGQADMQSIKKAVEREKQKREKETKDAEALSQKIKKLSLTISMKAGEDDKLYGSVGADEIKEALGREGIEIDKKKIVIEEAIKLLGVYNIPIKLSSSVSVPVKVWVVKE